MQVDIFELSLRKPVLEHMRIENVSVVTILDGYLRIAGVKHSLTVNFTLK